MKPHACLFFVFTGEASADVEGHCSKRQTCKEESYARSAPETVDAHRRAEHGFMECDVVSASESDAPEHDPVDDHRQLGNSVTSKTEGAHGLHCIEDVVEASEENELYGKRQHVQVRGVLVDDVCSSEVQEQGDRQRNRDGDQKASL